MNVTIAQSDDGRRIAGKHFKVVIVTYSYETLSGSAEHERDVADDGAGPSVVVEDLQLYVEKCINFLLNAHCFYRFESMAVARWLQYTFFD